MILSYFTTHSRITDNDSICDYTMNIATTMTSLRLLSLSLLVRRLHGEMEVERDVHYGTTMVWSPPEPLPERSLADAAIDESQLNALQDLYDATNASASLNFNDWLRPPTDPLHTHYCDFTGVSCDDELYVIGLDLNQTGLSGTIPDSIRNLERLRRFKVWMNDHLGEIPTAFGDLKHLEYLILGQNNFVGTIPDLSGATSLKRLLFQSNDLTGTVPTSLCNLSHLRELDLSRNGGLSGTLPACLGDLPDLRYVKVRDAEFSGGIPLELCARSEYGCDGIACAAGTYQFPHGRQTSDSRPCLVCPTSSGLIGCTRCDGGIGETYMPSSSPSATPSTAPSLLPSVSPRSPPSAEPSAAPSILPSVAFSVSPSAAPSILPSVFPSFAPSDVPTVFPSAVPSTAPTSSSRPPTDIPSNSPSQVLEMTKRPTSNVNPSPAPSLVTPSPTLIPSFVPTVLAAGVFSSFPSNSPTSKPALSPSTDFVIGGLNQGTYEDNTPKRWTWGIVAVILILASCCLVGLVGVGRRRRRHGSELSESIDCLPDDDSGVSPSTPSSVPVHPFSFLEIKSQVSLALVSVAVLCIVYAIAWSQPVHVSLCFSARCMTLKKGLQGILTIRVSNTLELRVNTRHPKMMKARRLTWKPR